MIQSNIYLKTVNTYVNYEITKDYSLRPECPTDFDTSDHTQRLQFLACVKVTFAWMNPILDKMSTVISFSWNERHQTKCGLLFLHNLALAAWTTVNCSDPIIGDIFCYIEPVSLVSWSLRHSLLSVAASGAVHQKTCVKKHNTCFKFETIISHAEKAHLARLAISNIHQFQFLFDAVEVTFPPMVIKNVDGSKSTHHHSRYSNIYVYRDVTRYMEMRNTLFILLYRLKNISGMNVFKCAEGAYISLSYLCDGYNDCSGKNPLDETGCECQNRDNYSSKCKYIRSHSHKKKCSVFFIKTREGNCKLYRPVAEDKNTSESQIKDGQLPCYKWNTSMFEVSEICSFQHDNESNLVPCSRGEHLQNCKEFECNMMFKCPNYFCIPWKYVCDGKWDCPGGFDESTCDRKRICSSMFICKGFSLCIHLGDICDRKFDCPFGDDEHFCSLKGSVCPSVCQCLTFVIKCYKTDVDKHFLITKLPHHVIILTKVLFLADHAASFDNALSLHVTNSNLQQVCSLISHMVFLRALNVSFNKIYHIETSCFAQATLVEIVDLKNNKLQNIFKGSFNDLRYLMFLDLSGNFLSEFSFSHLPIPCLYFLSLTSNTLSRLRVQDFLAINVKIISTQDHRICCAVPSGTSCLARIPWYVSCDQLLPNKSTKASFCCTSFIILIASCLSMLMLLTNQPHSSKTFSVTVVSINSVDASLVINMAFLWIADLYFQSDFVFRNVQWRSGAACFTVFGLSLNFALMSPLIICFLSLSRLMIVMNPIKTTFKETGIVVKEISCLLVFCSLLTVTVTTVTWITVKVIPISLCSPFVDPTHSVLIVQILACLVISVEMLAVNFILFVHQKLVLQLQKSQNMLHYSVAKARSKKSLEMQLLILTVSAILCWIPTCITYLVCMVMDQYPTNLVPWVMVAVTPVNSVVYPAVFVVNAARSVLKKKLRTDQQTNSLPT